MKKRAVTGVLGAGALIAPLLCLLIAGCGGGSDGPARFPVKGKVTFSGEPVQEGMVTFGNENFSSSGNITTTGEYKLADDLPVGTYKVQISPPDIQTPPSFSVTGEEPPKPKEYPNIPQKYRTLATTDLSAEVESSENDIPLKMEGT